MEMKIMTAKEMFEELGYKLARYGNDVEYCKQFEYAKINIYFTNFAKVIEISSNKDIAYTVDLKELQAINKQIEELGWLGSDSK